jgi:hypothetical protein
MSGDAGGVNGVPGSGNMLSDRATSTQAVELTAAPDAVESGRVVYEHEVSVSLLR